MIPYNKTTLMELMREYARYNEDIGWHKAKIDENEGLDVPNELEFHTEGQSRSENGAKTTFDRIIEHLVIFKR